MLTRLKTTFVLMAAIVALAAPSLQAATEPKPTEPDTPERGKLVLKVWSLPDPRSRVANVLAEFAVLRAFKEKYPHIELKSFTGISIEGVATDSRVLMAIAGGLGPDVMNFGFRQSDSYVSQGFLYPMDEFLERYDEEEVNSRIPGPVLPVVRRKGPDGTKHWYALPSEIGVRALAYRKDLFQAVGLDPSRPPENWAEMEEYAERLTRPDKGTYGLRFLTGGNASWDWLAFLYSAGGEAVVQDKETGEWEAAFDSDEAVEAMLFYIHLNCRKWPDATGKMQEGYVYRESEGYFKWLLGQIGMVWTSIEEGSFTIASGVDPNLIALAPVPRGPTGERIVELTAGMRGIFSEIQPRGGYSAEEVRQAAFDYIWFVTSDKANAIRTKVLVEEGGAKFVNPLWLKKYGYEEYIELASPEWVRVYEDALKHGKPEPYGKNCHMLYDIMNDPIAECLDRERQGKLGKTDAERRANIKNILQDAVAYANRDMIGIITPEERQRRNSIALVVGICMMTAFIFVLRKVWLILTPEDQLSVSQKGGWQLWRYRWAYIILLPAVVSILLWNYFPMLRGSLMVAQDYRIVGESKFTWAQNLADVLWDPVWWASLGRTLYYMALALGLGFWTPIVLAILLTEVSHGKILYRTLYYLPAVLTGMLVIYLWKLIFDPAETGVLNMLLAKVGIGRLQWLQDKRLAMFCCILPSIWAGMGPGCLIYLAALKSVPEDLYEAADIDGCGFFKKLRYITLPTIKGLIIINFIGAFIGASQSTGFILVMTFGGPNKATNVAGLHIFQKAYLALKFGTAVTMAWMLGVVMLGFTVIQLKRLSRMEFSTADSRKARSM